MKAYNAWGTGTEHNFLEEFHSIHPAKDKSKRTSLDYSEPLRLSLTVFFLSRKE
jgi:hypothetical protein